MGAVMGYTRIYRPDGSSNRACMRAYIGHIWGHIWGIYTRIHNHIWEQRMGHVCAHTWATYRGIHGPYGSSNGACMGAYMTIYRSSPIGRVGRKGIIGNSFLSLIIPAPSLPLPSLLEGKGAGVIPFPSLPYSVA